MTPTLTVAVVSFLSGGLVGMFISGAIHARRDSEVIAERGE